MEKVSQNNDNFPLPIPDNRVVSDDGFFTEVHGSLADENYVVKKHKGWLLDFQAEKIFDQCKRDYRELKSIFGDSIPNSIFTLADDPEPFRTDDYTYKNITIVQEKVFEDKELNDSTKVEKILKIEGFILKCIDIFDSTYDSKTKKGWCVDFTISNLVFGHTAFDDTPKLYFLDSMNAIMNTTVDKLQELVLKITESLGIDSAEITEKMRLIVKKIG
ncbi:MAG: hypothetical protein WCW14_00050 [Candidatus Paceibacterota bacterium]|jgi:hypothetical protein